MTLPGEDYYILMSLNVDTGIPTTIKTMGVNITTIVYLRVLIIEIGSTIVLMVVETQGRDIPTLGEIWFVKRIGLLFKDRICFCIF